MLLLVRRRSRFCSERRSAIICDPAITHLAGQDVGVPLAIVLSDSLWWATEHYEQRMADDCRLFLFFAI